MSSRTVAVVDDDGSSRTDLCDDVFDVTSFSALDVVEINSWLSMSLSALDVVELNVLCWGQPKCNTGKEQA